MIELVVALAVVAILIGPLLPAVQSARQAALRASSLNNLRQISLGMHSYTATKGGRLPGVAAVLRQPQGEDESVLNALIPFVEQEPPEGRLVSTGNDEEDLARYYPIRKTFISPGDPTVEGAKRASGPTSYAANIRCFAGKPYLVNGFPDGLSSTLAFCERYSRSWHPYQTPEHQATSPDSIVVFSYYETKFGRDFGTSTIGGDRRATVADDSWDGDVLPVTTAGPPARTLPSVPNATFQVRPTPANALSTMPQTPFRAGLPVAMFDGSARVIKLGISPEVFWGMFTPNGGEILGE